MQVIWLPNSAIGPKRDVAFSGPPAFWKNIVDSMTFELKWDLQGAPIPSPDQVVSKLSVIHDNQVIDSMNGSMIRLLCARFGLVWKLDEGGCRFDIPVTFDIRVGSPQHGLEMTNSLQNLQVFWSNQIDTNIKCQSVEVLGVIRAARNVAPRMTLFSGIFSSTQVRVACNPPSSPHQLDGLGICFPEEIETKNLQVCVYSDTVTSNPTKYDWPSIQIGENSDMAWLPVQFPPVEWVTVCITGLPADKPSLITVVCKWQ